MDSLNRDLGWQRDFKQSSSSICSETEICDVTNEEDNLNKSMFIGVIDISEERQGRIPCPVWLQTVNDCPLIVGQTNAIASKSLGFSGSDIGWTSRFESTFAVTDGEGDALIKGGILENPELPEQMVKRRTQVVASVSDEQWKLYRDVFNLLKTEHSLSCIALSYKILVDSEGLTVYERLHQVINDLEVFICSAEFEKRAIQRVHNLTLVMEVMIDAKFNISYP